MIKKSGGLTALSTIFQSYIVAVSFVGGGSRENTDLPQVTDKRYQIMLHGAHLT